MRPCNGSTALDRMYTIRQDLHVNPEISCQSCPTTDLPLLLYVGDVPVEASYHGSALLHRLLGDYPAERLTVIETAAPSASSRRLPEVNYLSHPIGKQRWLNTRFHSQAVAWFSRAATRRGPQISALLNGF